MAEEALRCFTSLVELVPGLITDLESVLETSKENQRSFIAEAKQADDALEHHEPIKQVHSTASSRRSEQSQPANPVRSPPLNAVAHSTRDQEQPTSADDAVRLAQRKRKTESNHSVERSGPAKYRSKDVAAVYYDGDVQNRLEAVVRSIGVCRNTMRKSRMSSKLRMVTRKGSLSGSDSSAGDKPLSAKAILASIGNRQIGGIARAKEAPAFGEADAYLDEAQSLCERAAHQVLRDGDCALEVNGAKEQLVGARQVSEAALPALRSEAEEEEAQRRASEDQRENVPGNVDNVLSAEDIDASDPFGGSSAEEDLEVDELYGREQGTDVDELDIDGIEADELEVDDEEDGEDLDIDPIVDLIQLNKYHSLKANRISQHAV